MGYFDRSILANNDQNNGQVSDITKLEAINTAIADEHDKTWAYVQSLVPVGLVTPVPPEFLSRQAIINGNFDIWQRGMGFTNPVNLQYLADHWRAHLGSGMPTTLTHSKQKMNPGELLGSNSYHRLTTDGAGTPSEYRLAQPIEGGTRFLCGQGKKIAVSFWARSSIPNKRLGIFIIQNYGSGGTPSTQDFINGQNWTLTSSWTKYTYTFSANDIAGKTFGSNNDDLSAINFQYAWDSFTQSRVGASTVETFLGAGNIDIARVQVNAGDEALPFQPRDPEEDERKCLRFNRRLGGSSFTAFGTGIAISTTQANVFVPFNVRGRIAIPTLTSSGGFRLMTGTNMVTTTGLAIDTNQSRPDGVVIIVTVASGLTAGNPVILQANNDTAAYLNFDMEL